MRLNKHPILGSFLAFISAAALAQTAPAIHTDEAWARFSAPGMSMSGVFMDLHNRSGRDDELLSANSPAAQTVELHTHVQEQGMMRMRQLPGGIALPQGQTVHLQPGGLHIMLMGLKQPLKAGEHVTLQLNFRHAPPQTISVPVETGAGRGAAAHNHKHSH